MKEKVVLKSAHPEEYPDLVIECKVIPNDKIGEYLETIPDEEKFQATKVAPVTARVGQEGEKIDTVLKTIVNGREYILSEESNVVKCRDGKNDMIVVNINSTSREQYIVKANKFESSYELDASTNMYVPVAEVRSFARVPENVIITTSWGAYAVCLEGSYIVTYDAASNDYNTVEAGAFDSTYIKQNSKIK